MPLREAPRARGIERTEPAQTQTGVVDPQSERELLPRGVHVPHRVVEQRQPAAVFAQDRRDEAVGQRHRFAGDGLPQRSRGRPAGRVDPVRPDVKGASEQRRERRALGRSEVLEQSRAGGQVPSRLLVDRAEAEVQQRRLPVRQDGSKQVRGRTRGCPGQASPRAFGQRKGNRVRSKLLTRGALTRLQVGEVREHPCPSVVHVGVCPSRGFMDDVDDVEERCRPRPRRIETCSAQETGRTARHRQAQQHARWLRPILRTRRRTNSSGRQEDQRQVPGARPPTEAGASPHRRFHHALRSWRRAPQVRRTSTRNARSEG